MKYIQSYAQLFLRLSLGTGFILPAVDRFGWLGPAGQSNVDWGSWSNFVSYTHILMPYLDLASTNVMAIMATGAEVLFGLLLLVGYQTRLAAIGSFLLTLSFALCMAIFMGFKAPFNYSVYTDSAASLVLATVGTYYWSLDHFLNKKNGTYQSLSFKNY